MSTIRISRGSVAVEWPDEPLRTKLCYWRGNRYEQLYVDNARRHTLVTLPGFAERVESLCDDPVVVDERVPMPEPDLGAASEGLEGPLAGPVAEAIRNGGGRISFPSVLGSAQVVAAILRAYPRDRLAERGTPLSIVAAQNTREAWRLGKRIRRLLPGRELSTMKGDSDDIIVTTYAMLPEMPRHLAGVFIGEDVSSQDLLQRIEAVSGIRNAARWGICPTPPGGEPEPDLAAEGLFGPKSASCTYAEAVAAGIAVPVRVCWVPSPRPNAPLGSAGFRLLEAIATQENAAFVETVADIAARVPDRLGCLVHAGTPAMATRVARLAPDIGTVCKRAGKAKRNELLDGIADGSVRRAIVTGDYIPRELCQDVVVAATCLGREFPGRLFPWRRRRRDGDMAYVVDFTHAWDVHNGRPGVLALNDEARRRRYREMGFGQIEVDGVDGLPFLG